MRDEPAPPRALPSPSRPPAMRRVPEQWLDIMSPFRGRAMSVHKPSAAWIREEFLRFFEGRGHQRVPSSSLIPAQDPTLLFTNAGMNQFKDVFVGGEERPCRRAAVVQNCVRVSGKHNALEQVGRTPRHHTFFEMLGNFSFGDYFKKEAIEFAWDLMTRVYGIPKDRLWVTVFRDDDDARVIWKRNVGIAEERVAGLGEKDNFWSMGDTGPCGPCSEIHIDMKHAWPEGRRDCSPGHDCGRFMELWNLVFMQFDRQPDGALKPLTKTGVDTGMGLERIASVLQGVESNYETDLFQPIVEETGRIARRDGGWNPARADDEDRVALHVIADHVRAMTFLISDGVVPSNEGRGYVLRRIIRRAIRFGRYLGIERPFLCDLSATVINIMGRDAGPYVAPHPELLAHATLVAETARREEERFAQTLAVGLAKVETLAQGLRADGKTQISGPDAFRLYDTFGLPLDLIKDVAHGTHLTVDEPGFEKAMEEQRERSRKGMKETASTVPAVASRLPARQTLFTGYETTLVEDARVLALVGGDAHPLLHAALQDVARLHVKHAGSLVSPDRFRFDFSHYTALSDDILAEVEDEVNDVIRQDLPIRSSVMPIDEALRRGALAFFGDKYGDVVRVVEVPGFSMELCGGTHAATTGSIGLFKIDQERGIAAGVRRIEALAGGQALREARQDKAIIESVQSALNVERPKVHEALQRLLDQNRALQREIDRLKINIAAGGPGRAEEDIKDVAGVKVLVRGPQEGLDKDAVRALVDRSRQRLPSGVIAQWAVRDDRVTVTSSVSRDLIPPLHAGDIVKELARLFDGRGGGKPDMAEAGGRSPGDLSAARDRTLEIVERFIRKVGAAR